MANINPIIPFRGGMPPYTGLLGLGAQIMIQGVLPVRLSANGRRHSFPAADGTTRANVDPSVPQPVEVQGVRLFDRVPGDVVDDATAARVAGRLRVEEQARESAEAKRRDREIKDLVKEFQDRLEATFERKRVLRMLEEGKPLDWWSLRAFDEYCVKHGLDPCPSRLARSVKERGSSRDSQ